MNESRRTGGRALLLRAGGLGDLLVALPSVALVRNAMPGWELTLAARPAHAALLVRAGLVDRTMAFDDPRLASIFSAGAAPVFHGPGRQTGGLGRDLEADATRAESARGILPNSVPGPGHSRWGYGLESYGLTVGWFNKPGSGPCPTTHGSAGLRETFFTTFDDRAGLTMSRFFFARTGGFFGRHAARGSGVAGAEFERFCDLGVDEAWRSEALRGLGLEWPAGRRLVVHPGSGGRAKRWPLRRFLEIMAWAASAGVAGVVVTGEAEAEMSAGPSIRGLPPCWTWISRPPVIELAGLLASAGAYLGNDSGPTHLAAACGARVTALFRNDLLSVWRPYGRTRVLSGEAIEDITVADVRSALVAMFDE
jgi:ADP-heptose:LPS heptosyltransferase